MRPKSDNGEQTEQDRGCAKDRLVGPLALGFDAEMGAGFLEGDLDLPATNEPSEDIAWAGVEIGCQKGLRLELAFGITNESQRIGTGGTPPRYQSAVPLAISTMRLVRPYHRLTR